MRQFELLTIVSFKEDLPEEGVRRGMKGTIVHIHEKPVLGYEIEVIDEHGESIIFALRAERLDSCSDIVWTPSES